MSYIRRGQVVDLEPGDPLWWLWTLEMRLLQRQAEMEQFDRFYRGEHPFPFLTRSHDAKMQDEFQRLLDESKSNFMRLVVDATEERLQVEGFRLSSEQDPVSDASAWELWQANQLDAQIPTAFVESLVKGVSYIGVWSDEDGDGYADIAIEDPLQTIVGYQGGSNYRRRVCALKIWLDELAGVRRANVYLPDGIYKFVASSDVPRYRIPTVQQAVEILWSEVVDEFVPNPVGVVPIIPLRNRPRLLIEGESEISDAWRLQNQINGFVFLLALAGYFGAHRQRWAVGLKIMEDANGNPIEPFDVAIDKLWVNEDPGGRFGEFSQTDLGGYIKAIEEKVLHIAVTTRTPRHYLVEQGQALALNTPVPTPTGMTTIGDLRAGDLVYDETGAAQIVSVAHPVLEERPCYRVAFSDGSEVVADENHLWFTQTIAERQLDQAPRYVRAEAPHRMRSGGNRAGSVRTTKQIAETLFYRRTDGSVILRGRKSTPRYNHSVPVAAALQASAADLAIDPYSLGVWLGDGSSAHAVVTQHEDDAPALQRELVAVGESVVVRPDRWPTTRRLALGRRGGVSFRTSLRQLGLLGKKHIPEAYFAASEEQRLALLQGIMDTDGTASKGRGVALELHDERLARDAHRLIQSLGWKCNLRSQTYTKTTGIESARGTFTRWRMCWTPDRVVFRLPRKAQKQLMSKNLNSNVKRRQIVAVEPVASVPVRCITVTGESSLFLIGEACIPTHNSPSGDAIQSAESGLVAKVERKQRVFGEGLEEAIRLARLFQGQGDSPIDSEIVWRDPRSHTPGVITDAVMKQYLGGLIPKTMALEQLGFTQTQIRQVMTAPEDQFSQPPPTDVAEAQRTDVLRNVPKGA